MKAQQLYAQGTIAVAKKRESVMSLSPVRLFDMKKNRLIIAAVILAHIGILAIAITKTTQYKPLNIINPADQQSIQVTMVELPEPEVIAPVQTPDPAPKILATENNVPEIVESPPDIPAKPVEKKPVIRKVIPKPVAKKVVKPLVSDKRPSEHKAVISQEKPHQIEDARVSDKTALPATASGPMLQSAPQADPKSVLTVGCEVPAPEYPRRAKRLQQQGQVLIRLVIAADGTLTHSEIARTSGVDELDRAALAAVSRIRCEPYIENGQRISVMTIQPIDFKISGN
ncbi:TonB family protein [Sodalis sp. RH16]|uniref:energy transducer TonB n=1 Tax=Sodalis sp. RH16 TaxID=3394331 RepID=UPI0039B6DE00